MLNCFSRVQLFAILWTIACQAPLSKIFSGKNTGVYCPALLEGIFPTHESNPCLLCLLHCRQILYPLSYLGSPIKANGNQKTKNLFLPAN